MSVTYVDASLRRLVAERAEDLCEYCLIQVEHTHFGCCIEHVIAEKHGGATEDDNLAYACVFCNRHKGSDLGSIDSVTDDLVRFFNPRTDRWRDHFRLENDMTIVPLTAIGRVTVKIFKLNAGERLLERRELHGWGDYPTEAALRRIVGSSS